MNPTALNWAGMGRTGSSSLAISWQVVLERGEQDSFLTFVLFSKRKKKKKVCAV